MQDAIRIVAGDCTVTYEGDETREQRGHVVALVKPDNTVLVHDADGYQPAAWITRADTVRFARDGAGVRLVAGKGDERLRVDCRHDADHAHYPASPAGPAVGECPSCGGALVRSGGRVVCVDCRDAYTIPRDATVIDEQCPDCGLPLLRAVRGTELTVCVNYACESLADALADAVGNDWRCPDCNRALAVSYRRGLRAVCEDCEHSFPVPAAAAVDTCDCGLPRFDVDGGRCLDPDCECAS